MNGLERRPLPRPLIVIALIIAMAIWTLAGPWFVRRLESARDALARSADAQRQVSAALASLSPPSVPPHSSFIIVLEDPQFADYEQMFAFAAHLNQDGYRCRSVTEVGGMVVFLVTSKALP